MICEPLRESCGRAIYTNPAPVIRRAFLADLSGNRHPLNWSGVIDTGADFSVVPVSACQDLGLTPRDWSRPRGFDHREVRDRVPIYYVRIQIDNVGDFCSKAYGVQRDTLLIGRDLLVHLAFVFDGKATRFQVGQHSFWTKSAFRVLRLF